MDKKEFIQKWLASFAPNITDRQYNRFIKDLYIWHVFSFELIDKSLYLEGDEARQAYDKADKTDAITFQLFSSYPSTLPLTEEFDNSYKLENEDEVYMEFYVVGKDFSWSYIVTHEYGICGPYFIQANK